MAGSANDCAGRSSGYLPPSTSSGWCGAALLRWLPRHLRSRQCGRAWRGAVGAARPIAVLPRAQRAGDAACCPRGMRANRTALVRSCVHDVDRAGRDEPRSQVLALATGTGCRCCRAGRCIRVAAFRSGAAALESSVAGDSRLTRRCGVRRTPTASTSSPARTSRRESPT
jgi:hypothetical protein